MAEDARQIIFEELSSAPVRKKLAGDSYMIQCPFHDDNTPSCGVNLTVDTDVPLGYFHCLGCGTKGHWNKLAEKLDLKQIKGWQLGFSGNGLRRSRRKEKVLKYESEDEQTRRALRTLEMIDWPASRPWRGYEGSLIRKIGGKFYNDHMTDETMLFFPIRVKGKLQGGVRAYLEKQTNGLSYLTTRGQWVKSYGLLGHEYVKRVVRKRGYTAVVVVEGPRDLLRLLHNRIPAVAILGVENFSRKKMMRILAMSSKIDTLYVMPDNDKAGTRMYRLIKAIAEEDNLVKVKRLKLPQDKDKKGRLVKMDPDDAPQEIIDNVKNMIENHRR